MKTLIIMSLFLTSCVCLDPAHKQGNAPSVETGRVIEDLKSTKEELTRAGAANTAVGKSVDQALTLAQKLDQILEQLEKTQNKNVVNPE